MPAAPAPLQTILVSSILRPVRSSALSRPAVEMIAVPCWSSWNTGMSSSSRSRCSMMKHSGALMSSRLMPPQPLPSSFTQLMISSGSSDVHFEVDGVDVGEALEQHRLAFHHRLRRQRAEVAEAQDRGAVGDDGDEVAFGGVVVGVVLVLGDGQHRHRDAGRIGQRQVALRRHRLGGDDFELAGAALAVEQQRFLVGEGRPIALDFFAISTLYPRPPGRKRDVSGTAGRFSRETSAR